VEGKAAFNEEKSRQIRDFLREFKCIAAKNGIYVISRDKNQQALAELGLTSKNRFDIIMTLSVADYCMGLEPDRDKAGCIWEFGRIVEGRLVYIKLEIAGTDGGDIARCISFHAAEFPLSFPCKGEEN
jgi:hypothetical protein